MDLKLIILALVITFSSGDESTVKDVRPSALISKNKEELESTIIPDISTIQPTKIALKPVVNVSNIKENNNSIHKNEGSVQTAASEIKINATEISQTNTEETSLDSLTTKSSVATKPPVTAEPSVTTELVQPIVITTGIAIEDVKGQPEPGDWKVHDNKTKTLCIMAHLQIQFNLTYPSQNGSTKNTTLFIPKKAQESGACLNSTQNIKLQWDNGNSFEIIFAINKTSKSFGIDSFYLYVNTTAFEDIKGNVSNMIYSNNKTGFPVTPLNMSYKCDKLWMKNLTSVDDLYVATLILSHVQLEAFKNSSNEMFSEAKDCEGFNTPDIVPIVVGFVLSVLVLIVLAAYLIGRRRSQNRGYLSM